MPTHTPLDICTCAPKLKNTMENQVLYLAEARMRLQNEINRLYENFEFSEIPEYTEGKIQGLTYSIAIIDALIKEKAI